jgi:hypothetical protein
MVYHRRRATRSGRAPAGFYRFENLNHRCVSGYSDGDYVRLRDEHGNVWRGTAESQGDETVRYRFRDDFGHVISGISDRLGILLRDEKGNTWRGFVY